MDRLSLRPLIRLVVVLTFVGLLPASPGAADAQEPGPGRPLFAESELTADEGHVTMQWDLTEAVEQGRLGLTFELEQSDDPGFEDPRLRHRGAERSFFVSGLREGHTYFRVRAIAGGVAGPWSDTLVVQVDYPGRGRVTGLVIVGCLVFLATVTAIIAGWLRFDRSRLRERRPAS